MFFPLPCILRKWHFLINFVDSTCLRYCIISVFLRMTSDICTKNVAFINESEQFSSLWNLINLERNIALRNVVLIQTPHEAAVFLYDRRKWILDIHYVNTSKSFYSFPNLLCRIVGNSYDILMIKIKADSIHEAWYCWVHLLIFWSHFRLM